MHFRRQARYKRHVHQRCLEVRALISWEGLHFGPSHLQFWEDDFVSQSQHFVWPGLTFSWQAQDFRDMDWKNRKTQWHEAVSSALNFPLLKEISQNCFVFDVIKIKSRGSLPKLLRFLCCHLQKWRKLSRIASLLMLSQLQDNMPREFASKKLESMPWNCWCNQWCTGDRQLLLVVCLLALILWKYFYEAGSFGLPVAFPEANTSHMSVATGSGRSTGPIRRTMSQGALPSWFLRSSTVSFLTTATTATAPITFRSISGFALPSVIHNNQPLL